MNLFWRFLITYLCSRFANKVDLFSECSKSFYVLPTDIDLLMHMNNGRYFSMMDIARLDFMLRAQVFQKFRKHKIYPVVASELIRFKKSIKLFEKYQITTKIISWDEKYFYISHYFICNKKTCAASIVKVCFLRTTKNIVTTNEILQLLNINKQPDALPNWITEWQQAEAEFLQHKNNI